MVQVNSALVIEDDEATANAIARVVASLGHEVRTASTLEQARAIADEMLPTLVMVDLGMPDGDGVQIVHELRGRGVEDFIVISGSQSQERVLESLRAGVADFLVKPVKLSEIHRVVNRVVQMREDRQIGVATPAAPFVIEPARLVGTSEAARHLRHSVQRVARLAPLRAIVTGAPGVGKRNIAASIHHESQAEGRALHVNCAQEVDEAATARLFGRVADEKDGKPAIEGYIVGARNGTLVLDDLSRLPIALQSKLTTFLSTGEVTPVGGYASVEVDCAVIAILREPVAEAFAGERLKEDLYYRLAEAVVTVPPLSERENDTLEIAERAVAELNALTGTDKALSAELRERLRSYTWPGQRGRAQEHVAGGVRRYRARRGDRDRQGVRAGAVGRQRRSRRPPRRQQLLGCREEAPARDARVHRRQQASGGQAPRHQPEDLVQPSARLRMSVARARPPGATMGVGRPESRMSSLAARRLFPRLLPVGPALAAALFVGGCENPQLRDVTPSLEDDSALARDVGEALDERPELGRFSIAVKSLDEGTVRLSGRVDNEAQRHTAGEAASRVAGVRSVINTIYVRD